MSVLLNERMSQFFYRVGAEESLILKNSPEG